MSINTKHYKYIYSQKYLLWEILINKLNLKKIIQMKSIFNYKTTLWFLVGFFLYSCQIKESMKINEDGSGSINYSLDMGAFMSTISKTKKNTDSTGTVAKESSKKVIDTVMYFNKMLENMPARFCC